MSDELRVDYVFFDSGGRRILMLFGADSPAEAEKLGEQFLPTYAEEKLDEPFDASRWKSAAIRKHIPPAPAGWAILAERDDAEPLLETFKERIRE